MNFALFAESNSIIYEKTSHDKKWDKAMAEEIESIEKNKICLLTNLPPGHKAIDLKWVYRTKLKSNGAVEKYKARVVAKVLNRKELIMMRYSH